MRKNNDFSLSKYLAIFFLHCLIVNSFELVDHGNNLGGVDMSGYGAFARALRAEPILDSNASVLFLSDVANSVARFKAVVALGDIVVHLSRGWHF